MLLDENVPVKCNFHLPYLQAIAAAPLPLVASKEINS
jgi:hypothetical protein